MKYEMSLKNDCGYNGYYIIINGNGRNYIKYGEYTSLNYSFLNATMLYKQYLI